MPKLNQIIAIEKTVKSQSLRELTDAHKLLQKDSLLAGIARTYRSRDDEGETYPPESTRVQVRADEMIDKTVEILSKLFDVTATKDWANNNARADVTIDGKLENYSKAQAEFVLRDFFKAHPPNEFNVIHQGSSKGGQPFAIGMYKSGSDTYRVWMKIKSVDKTQLIQEISFVKE